MGPARGGPVLSPKDAGSPRGTVWLCLETTTPVPIGTTPPRCGGAGLRIGTDRGWTDPIIRGRKDAINPDAAACPRPADAVDPPDAGTIRTGGADARRGDRGPDPAA